ncbi:riboflavin biosynthesis protein RibF [bacterium]|jgi:riboflavin kinase / FMN adenylyltransferase|nr:riboflavin biosynthesis protein RibF [bacterium]
MKTQSDATDFSDKLNIQGHIRPGLSIGLGIFDGLHKGHQSFLDKIDALLTFFPHPSSVLGKRQIDYLTLPHELRDLVEQESKQLWIAEFTAELASLSPDAFLDTLKNVCHPQKIVVGYDFRFGSNRAGTTEHLSDWAKSNGIDTTILDPVINPDATPYKSSLARDFIRDGLLSDAIDIMGHPYPIYGTVIRGDGRGKALGVPTANIQVPPTKLIPAPGVYSGHAILPNGDQARAGIYIGSKPTFKGQSLSIEAHLLDQSIDLYDAPLKLFLETKIRDEKRFDSKEALIHQIKIDLAVL